MRSWQRWTLVTVLAVIGIFLLLIGYTYAHRTAAHLPHVLGRIKGAHYHRTKRELVAFVAGGVFLLLALAAAYFGRGPRYVEPAAPPAAPPPPSDSNEVNPL